MPFEQHALLEWQNHPNGYCYLVYYCNNCKNGWTTTECDEMTLKKRNIANIRISKIKKINAL
jgi:hypothetical protein